MADWVRLRNMQFYAHHGVAPEERVLGQRFEFDVALRADLRPAGRSDDLADALDYQRVYALVAAAMEPPCLLLEAVAERIAARVLSACAVEAVRVTVRKPSVPLGGVLGCAEVEIERP